MTKPNRLIFLYIFNVKTYIISRFASCLTLVLEKKHRNKLHSIKTKTNFTFVHYRKSPKSPKVERVKQPRVWELGGNTRDLPSLDFSTDKAEDANNEVTPDTQV